MLTPEMQLLLNDYNLIEKVIINNSKVIYSFFQLNFKN